MKADFRRTLPRVMAGSLAAALAIAAFLATTATAHAAGGTATSVTLSAASTSLSFGRPDTFTATVGAANSSTTGVVGTVQFLNGAVSLGSVATTVTGAGTIASPGVGTADMTTSSLPPGANGITAVFTPTSTAYATANSTQVAVDVAPAPVCSLAGSNCSNTSNFHVRVDPGGLTMTTPYTPTFPFVLPAMTLSPDGTFLESSATFPDPSLPNSEQIAVTSSVAPAYAWTVSVSATPLSNGGAGSIPSSGLGLTNGALLNASGTGAYEGAVSFTNIPAFNPSPSDGAGTGPGLNTAPETFANSNAADGTAVMDATLTIFAATSTPAGTYNGTITFSVA